MMNINALLVNDEIHINVETSYTLGTGIFLVRKKNILFCLKSYISTY